MLPKTEYDLSDNQRLFADEYIKTGKAAESYMKFYKAKGNVAAAAASRLLTNVKIKLYIEEMSKTIKKSTIADIEEIKEFWTKMFREGTHTISVNGQSADVLVDVKDRLKASEFLAKTGGAFIENVQHSGKDGNELTINIIKAK